MKLNNRENSKKVISFISQLNQQNNSTLWWALNFTSKNPLSSKLFKDLLLLINSIQYSVEDNSIAKESQFNNKVQKEIIDKYFKTNKKYKFKLYFLLKFIVNLAKSILLLIDSYLFTLFSKNNFIESETLIFSFVDSRFRGTKDIYFGDLIDKMKLDNSKKSISYLFYVYRPYYKNIKNLLEEKNSYIFLFKFLTLSDYLWCFKNILNFYYLKPIIPTFKINNKNIDLNLLVKDCIIDEISSGLIDNLLIFRAFKRLNKIKSLKLIIYPFENKSLEKMMLFALDNNLKTVGYQHSAISNRHFSLIINPDESQFIPLPNKIITTGHITKDWLVTKGNIPSDKISVGVSLRNSSFHYLEKKIESKNKVKLLFPFSSSHKETYNTINFLSKINNLSSLELKFRFHPDFPLNKLSKQARSWLEVNKIILSDSNLLDDFKWADITCYISSSLAIESLMNNVPVIRLNIDTFDSDPLLDQDIPLKWQIETQNEFIETISFIAKIDKFDRKERYSKSKKIIDQYLIDRSKLNLEVFID